MRQKRVRSWSRRTGQRRGSSKVAARLSLQVRYRRVGKNFGDLSLNLTPNVYHRTTRQLFTTQVRVHTGVDCDGPFNRCDHIVERDLLGRTGKGISAACTSL